MQEVGPLGADGADHVARHPRADVGAAADAPVRDAQLVEALVEARCVAAGDVEPEEARVDAALAQGGQQREQVALRAADARQLVDVEDLHARAAAGRAPRSRPPSGSTANRARTSAAPCRAERARAARGRARARRAGRPARVDVADRLEEAALAVRDDRRRAAGPRRDDRPLGRQRLDRDDRRALVRRGQQEASNAAYQGRMLLLEADEPAAVGDAELARERLRLPRGPRRRRRARAPRRPRRRRARAASGPGRAAA